MTFAADSEAKWRAVSRPRPTLEPVTMIVWLAKEVVGTGRVCHWFLTKDRTAAMAVVVVVYVTIGMKKCFCEV